MESDCSSAIRSRPSFRSHSDMWGSGSTPYQRVERLDLLVVSETPVPEALFEQCGLHFGGRERYALRNFPYGHAVHAPSTRLSLPVPYVKAIIAHSSSSCKSTRLTPLSRRLNTVFAG